MEARELDRIDRPNGVYPNGGRREVAEGIATLRQINETRERATLARVEARRRNRRRSQREAERRTARRHGLSNVMLAAGAASILAALYHVGEYGATWVAVLGLFVALGCIVISPVVYRGCS